MTGRYEHGNRRREKVISIAMKRKEDYLGARVPKELRDKVINRAKDLGIPVSILIRNILENEFSNNIEANTVLNQIDDGEKNKSSDDKYESVIGWEKIELNKTVNCSECGIRIDQGSSALLGLGAPRPIVLCETCKERL